MLYNALPKKEYERVFMCKTAKDIWQSLIITHQGNSQVKDNKIDLLVQQYEQFVISEDETIDSAFAKFNTIITSLKALDESFSSKNFVRKFLRALHPKWRAKVTAIEESKDLSSMTLDELIGNLKVHEMIMEKDSEIVKGKKEKIKSIALKAKVESSDDESCSNSDDEEYAMAVRDFKKFFRRRGKFVKPPRDEKKSSRKDRDDKKGKDDRKCYRCGDSSHLIGECPKPPKTKSQRAFVSGAWSDSEGDDDDEPKNNEMALMANDTEEVHSDSYSSIDDEILEVEYNKLCDVTLKIINKNKFLKTKTTLLENEVFWLKEKAIRIEKGKDSKETCVSCQELKLELETLRTTQEDLIKQNSKFKRFDKNISCADEIMKMQKLPHDKTGLGFMKLGTLSEYKEQTVNKTDSTKLDTHGSDGSKNLDPPSVSKGSASTEVEQKVHKVDRSEFVKVTKKPNSSITNNKHKPAVSLGRGQARNEYRVKTDQQRPQMSFPKHPFPKSIVNPQHTYQNNWNQNIPRNFHGPSYMSWNNCPPFTYINHDNVMFNPNGPMRYWGPNA